MSDEPPNSSNEHLHPARAFRNNKHTVSDIGFADERVRVAIYASLSRVIEVAPIENKMRVFGLMAQTAAADTAAYRQQMIDDLWYVAEDVGLIAVTGTAAVQNTLAIAFAGGAL